MLVTEEMPVDVTDDVPVPSQRHLLLISRGYYVAWDKNGTVLIEETVVGTAPDGKRIVRWVERDVQHFGCRTTIVDMFGENWERYACGVEWEIDNWGFLSIEDELAGLDPGVYEIEYWFEEDHIPMVGVEYDHGLRIVGKVAQ